MSPQQALTNNGWAFHQHCAPCQGGKQDWRKASRPDDKILFNPNQSYYYHYVGVFCVKADYLSNLNAYLQTLTP